ncbi:MAG TPA: hydroxyacylglutathione hydrolase [Rhodobacteraceae bacterium]|nr:hydroxyacylglutathione hydrolase [Paracoccaceae bacterium]
MPLQIATIPCRSDNYAFLLHDKDSGETALVDAPEAAPIIEVLENRSWNLTQIMITHHHYDHIDGVEELRRKYGAKVIGSKADAHRLPPLDTEISEGDTLTVGDNKGIVLDVSGHCDNHLAFHFPESAAVFTADSLMALGCGRVFEGTPQQMWASLSKLAALPEMTIVYSGHEYTAANASFAYTIEPGNPALKDRILQIIEARAQNMPTVPSLLSDELATNPFLRAHSPEIRQRLGMESAADAEVFAEIRRRKDNFKATEMPDITEEPCNCAYD